jgi:hypothetical protein
LFVNECVMQAWNTFGNDQQLGLWLPLKTKGEGSWLAGFFYFLKKQEDGVGAQFKWCSGHQASAGPWVQFPVRKERKKVI